MALHNDILWDAPPGVRGAIDAFRRHIMEANQSNWMLAQPLIHQVAVELHREVNGPPGKHIKLKPVADLLHVDVELPDRESRGREAELRPVEGGYIATLFRRCRRRVEPAVYLWDEDSAFVFPTDESALSARGRMVLAHELGHTCFYTSDHRRAKPERIVPSGMVGSGRHAREEGLCQTFAGALLLGPKPAGGLGEPCMRTVLRLSAQHFVSTEVVVRRVLYEWELWPTCVFARIDTRPPSPRVQLFRGAASKRLKGLARSSLEEKLAGRQTPEEVAEALGGPDGSPWSQFAFSGVYVWALLTV